MPTSRQQSSQVFENQQKRVAMAASDSTAAASLLQGQNQFVLEATFDSTLKRHRHHHNAAAKIHHEFATNDSHESAEVAHSAKQTLLYVRILHRNEEQSFVPSTGRQSGRGCQASSKTATTTYSRDVSQCHTWDLRRKGRTAW